MESIRRCFVCVRKRHKSHSPAIKATTLVIQECAGCIFPVSIYPLFSAHFVVLSSHSNFLLHTCPKGEWTLFFPLSTLVFPSVFVSHFPIMLAICPLFFLLLPFLPFFPLLPPSALLRLQGCMVVPFVKAPSHCKRMSLSHRKQSAFIMSYLLRPPQQQS